MGRHVVEFDVAAVPFSRFGSYMALNVLPAHWDVNGLVLRTMRGTFASRQAFVLEPISGRQPVPYSLTATPTALRLEGGGGDVTFCFAETDLLRVRGRGLGLRLSSLREHSSYAFPAGEGRWHVNCAPNRAQFMLTSLRGELVMDALNVVRTQDKRKKHREVRRPRVVADLLPDESGRFEAAVEEFVTTSASPDLSASFDDCLRSVEAEWQAWLKTTPAMPGRYGEAAELAMYVNWASAVAPSGNFRRPTVLMSKNWMTQCWSWDHCFNAIALSYRNPDLAWDQLMAPFDHQDEHGVLPDSISEPRLTWNFCKPPIHGWALGKMMNKRGLLTEKRLKEVYRPLCRWTDWWLKERDYDGDGLPEYHHGNDSGWDNATVFDGGFPAAAPDLAAYLIVQMDVLTRLAKRLGRRRDADRWKSHSGALRDRMLEHLWNGEQFVTRRGFTGDIFPEGDSLLNYMAIVAGRRLPKAVRERMAGALKPGGRFVTDYGPATESPNSPLYVPDGYWRGPIWGSETVLLVDGLARAGYADQAREVARRYCDMCLGSGFAENYDATTGEPLRDKAYTWGSSAFLILAHEFSRPSARG
jgi:glycogen debranching enzyme